MSTDRPAAAQRIVWSYGHPGVAGSGPGDLSNPDDAVPAHERRCFRSPTSRTVASCASAATHRDPAIDRPCRRLRPRPAARALLAERRHAARGRRRARDGDRRVGRPDQRVRAPALLPPHARRHTRRTRSCFRTGTSSSPASTRPAASTSSHRQGAIVWTYGPSSGPGSLDRPSLAVRWPNGMIAVTDDWHHRVIVIDPATKRIVWSYGHKGVTGTAPGYLYKPDGLDLLPAVGPTAARRRP